MNKIMQLILFIQKFFYYGYIGATKTFDFDANSIDQLIYAHIKRVRKFMDSKNTHTLWASREKGLKRKLYEFEELCKRKCKNDDLNDFYYYRKETKHNNIKNYFSIKDENTKKRIKKAIVKDRKIALQKKKRYEKMLIDYVPYFWD